MSTVKNKNILEQLRLKLRKNLRTMRRGQNFLVLIEKKACVCYSFVKRKVVQECLRSFISVTI